MTSRAEAVEQVEAVARRALAPGFGGEPAAVPAEMAAAVARGEGDRAQVAALARSAFGEGPSLDLVLVDTDRIGEFVFESARLPVIEGASRLLRELNQEIPRRFEREAVFSAGGEALLLAAHGNGEEIRTGIAELFRERTAGALTATVEVLEIGPEDFIAGAAEPAGDPAPGEPRLVAGTRAVLSRLRDRVRRAKETRADLGKPVSGAADRCVSCRVRAGVHAIERRRPDDPPGLLCAPCERRWDWGRWRTNGKSFDDIVEAFQESLGGDGTDPAGGRRARYLGLVYLDGNGLGTVFGRLHSLAALRFLSSATSAVFERLETHARKRVEHLTGPEIEHDDLPLLAYLGGGDEAIWIAPGALAVDLAAKAASWVAQEAAARPELVDLLGGAGLPSGLTVAVGLVLCDRGYPVRYQRELAGDLQKGVKKLLAPPGADLVSGVDFELVTDGYPRGDLRIARQAAYGTEERDFVRTCRPYTADGFARLVEAARSAHRHRVATSQLYTLQTGAREGEAVFLNFLRYQLARRAARRDFEPWLQEQGVWLADREALDRFFVHELKTGERGTWLSDLLELMPFVRHVGHLEAEAGVAAA